MALITDLVYILVLLIISPVILYRMIAKGKYFRDIKDRFGGGEPRQSNKNCILLHGVSVGEIIAAKPLIQGLKEAYPEWEIVITTTTRTGAQVAAKHYEKLTRIRYPFDFSFAVRRVLNRIRPDVVILMELEIWPNFVRGCQLRGIPVIIANVRISERSFLGYKRILLLIRNTLARISFFAVQNDEYKKRLLELGVAEQKNMCNG